MPRYHATFEYDAPDDTTARRIARNLETPGGPQNRRLVWMEKETIALVAMSLDPDARERLEVDPSRDLSRASSHVPEGPERPPSFWDWGA